MFVSHPTSVITQELGLRFVLRHLAVAFPGGPSTFLPLGARTLGPDQCFQPGPAPTHSSHLIGPACGDVVGIADRTPSARRAGGTVRHPGLCYLVVSPPGHGHVPAAAARSGVPAAAAAAMVSPVTVVSERASERALVLLCRSPPAWGLH